MTPTQFTDSITDEAPDPGLSAPLSALWWDAKGDWTRAHNLVDDLTTKSGMAVHAYLHRRDGAGSNAEYWYARSGTDHRRESLVDEWKALVVALL